MIFGRIENLTAMKVGATVLDDRRGREVLTVIAKMTWAVTAAGVVSIPGRRSEVRREDVWTGRALASSLRYPSDLVPERPGTDVLLIGTASPPADRAVTSVDVRLTVGDRRALLEKSVRVHGPRVWYAGLQGVAPGAAGRLKPTPLIWELAYGGTDRSDPERPLVEDANPIGTGVARARGNLAGQVAPAIEDPERGLGSRSPAAAGFGPIPAQWAPRVRYAGTYDDAWKRERAPLPPVDRDPRFYSCAPEGLRTAEPLLGDELFEISGVTPAGLWRFRLPRCAPVFSCVVRGSTHACPTHLDTVLVDADAGRVEQTFRTSIPVPRKLQAIERVRVEDGVPLPAKLLADAGLTVSCDEE